MISDRDADVVYVADRLAPAHPSLAGGLQEVLACHGIDLRELSGSRDIWYRDYMPIQIGDGEFVQFRYDQDYLSGHEHLITRPGDVGPVPEVGGCVDSDIVLDGVNVVRWASRCVVTDKVFRQDPRLVRAELLARLPEALRVEDLIEVLNEPSSLPTTPTGRSNSSTTAWWRSTTDRPRTRGTSGGWLTALRIDQPVVSRSAESGEIERMPFRKVTNQLVKMPRQPTWPT